MLNYQKKLYINIQIIFGTEVNMLYFSDNRTNIYFTFYHLENFQVNLFFIKKIIKLKDSQFNNFFFPWQVK